MLGISLGMIKNMILLFVYLSMGLSIKKSTNIRRVNVRKRGCRIVKEEQWISRFVLHLRGNCKRMSIVTEISTTAKSAGQAQQRVIADSQLTQSSR